MRGLQRAVGGPDGVARLGEALFHVGEALGASAIVFSNFATFCFAVSAAFFAASIMAGPLSRAAVRVVSSCWAAKSQHRPERL